MSSLVFTPFSDRKRRRANWDLCVKIHDSGVSVDDRFKDVRSGGREKIGKTNLVSFLRMVAMSNLPLNPQCLAHESLINVLSKE